MFFSGFDIKTSTYAHKTCIFWKKQQRKKQQQKKPPEYLERRVIFGVVDNSLYLEMDLKYLWLLLEKSTQFKVFKWSYMLGY